MKVKIKYIFMVFAFLMMLSSCDKTNGIIDVELSSNNPTECTIADFKYDEFHIVRTYKNGSTDEIPLKEDMISEYEKLKFFQPGKQTVEVTYMGAKLSLEVFVNRNKFNVELKPDTVTYNGLPHELSFEGYLPNNATITYPLGKSFVDVGTHMVKAIISCPSFETTILEEFLTINLATIDMSDVEFKNETFKYNGEAKEIIEIENLPENVEVTYLVNGNKEQKMVDAGTYTITAEFRVKEGSKNYNQIEKMTATYTIEKGVYDVSDIALKDTEVYYTGNVHEWVLANELPDWIYVTYENNKETEIGIYDDILVTLRSTNKNYHFKKADGSYDTEITIKLEAAIIPME